MRIAGDDIVTRFLGAVASLDYERAASLVREDFVAAVAPGMLQPGRKRAYEGRDGVRDWLQDLAARCGGAPRLEHRIRAKEDVILAVGTCAGAERDPGRAGALAAPEAAEPFAWVFRVAGDEIASVQMYRHLDEVIAAMGELPGFGAGGPERGS